MSLIVSIKADRVVTKLNKDHDLFKHLTCILEKLDNTLPDSKIEEIIVKYIDNTFKVRDDSSRKVINYLERYLTI